MHLILGAGNLGCDLFEVLSGHGEKVEILSREMNSTGGKTFSYGSPEGLQVSDLRQLNPEVVWCAVGAGGPTRDPEAIKRQYLLNVNLPADLIQTFANTTTKVVLFSTHYLNNDYFGSHSEYAKTKAKMEELAHDRKNVMVLRVGSLYGDHKPLETLPGKIVKALWNKQRQFTGMVNQITPSHTRWVAQRICESRMWEFSMSNMNVSPLGQTRVVDWVSKIVEVARLMMNIREPVTITPDGVDPNYPQFSAGISAWDDGWEHTWESTCQEVINAAILQMGLASASSRNSQQRQS